MLLSSSWPENKISAAFRAADQYGTPLYYLDSEILLENVAQLRRSLPDEVRLCYSLKSNPFFLSSADEALDLIEVCSPGEFCILEYASFPSARTIVGGIFKSEAELSRLAERPPYRISIESLQQLKTLNRFARQFHTAPEVLLRLSSGNQFGMNDIEIREVLSHPDEFSSIVFRGLHYYSGTNKKKPSDIEADLTVLTDFIRSLDTDPEEIEYGPGLGVPMFAVQQQGDYLPCLTALVNMTTELCRSHQVTLELGRIITFNAGVYLSTLTEVKARDNHRFWILDGGIHHLSYYGQMAGRPIPIVIQSESINKKICPVILCGALCTTFDLLANQVQLHDAPIGSKLMFLNAGAYSVTEARSLFLSHPLPIIVMQGKNGIVQIRPKQETYPFNTFSQE